MSESEEQEGAVDGTPSRCAHDRALRLAIDDNRPLRHVVEIRQWLHD